MWVSQATLLIKNLPASAEYIRDAGFTPGSGRSPGEGHDNSFQYSCLENPVDKGAVHSVGRLQSIV